MTLLQQALEALVNSTPIRATQHNAAIKAISAAIEAGAVVQQGWIAVTERLPKPYDEVMVWPVPSHNSRTAEVTTLGAWRYSEYELHFGWNEYGCNVTHWQPLPPAPKEQA